MSIEIKTISPSDIAAWDDYVYNHPQATLYHMSGWKNVIEKTYGHKTYYLMATDSSQPIAHSLKCNKNREKIMKTIQTQVPEQIYKKALDLVKQGWFRDEQDIFYEAIRRYLDSHRPDLMEKFIRDDVEWGLHGND